MHLFGDSLGATQRELWFGSGPQPMSQTRQPSVIEHKFELRYRRIVPQLSGVDWAEMNLEQVA